MKKDGGGVVILVSKCLKSKMQLSWNSLSEDIWVTISTQKSVKLHLCCVYLPPQTDMSIYRAHCSKIIELTLLYPKDKFLIVGDYNLMGVKWLTKDKHFEPLYTSNLDFYLEVINTMHLCNLHQYNGCINVNNRILDLVFCSENVNVTLCNDPISKIDMHHMPIEITINFEPVKELNSKQCNSYNFNGCNYEEIIYKLSAIKWNEKLNSNDIDKNVKCFYNILYSIIDVYVPIKSKTNNKYPIWFSNSLVKMLKEKNKYHKRWKIYQNLADYNTYSLLRKRVKLYLVENHKSYIQKVETNIKANIKSFWNYTKKMKSNNNLPNIMHLNNIEAKTGVDICNLFADHFESVYTTSICNSNNSSETYNSINIGSVQLTAEEIFNGLSSIDSKLGPGPDRISPHFIKYCAFYLVEPLKIIFNDSLRTGVFPTVWKESFITPIFKSGDISDVKNYRPITKLSLFPKIFESLIVKKIHFDLQNIIIPEQHGFCPGKSVLTNLIPFTHSLSLNMDQRKQIDVIYTDFTKAFDRVNHDLLIAKLKHNGVHGSLLRWIESYIKNRSQFVVSNGYTSRKIMVTSGVPQGSHLGPILFNIFINSISECFKYSEFQLFADDLKLYKCINSLQDCLELQEDVDRLNNYCISNDLHLNINKCYLVRFTRNRKLIQYNYHITGNILEVKNTIRDLGIIYDSKLMFNTHIDEIVKKAYKLLGFILRVCKSFTSVESLIILYKSLVRSQLEFITPIWNPHCAKYITKIESIQNKFIYIISRKFNLTSIECNKFNIIPLVKRRLINDMMVIYNILNNNINTELFIHHLKVNVPQKITRAYSQNFFLLPQCYTNNHKYSILNRIMSNYNHINKCQDVFSVSFHQYKNYISQLLE